MPTLDAILQRLRAMGDPERAAHNQGFFKTAPGEYAAGDRFLGVRVPLVRQLVREYRGLDLQTLPGLLNSPWHEVRLFALLTMVDMFSRANQAGREAVYGLYMQHRQGVNNWDLVDVSAPGIVGRWLWRRDRSPLLRLADADSLWERRIAVMATFHFIRKGDFHTTIELSERLLADPKDLIHKAVGWMLREVGKRNREVEEAFLRAHCRAMPRTMLRYAIEKFPPDLRRRYMHPD